MSFKRSHPRSAPCPTNTPSPFAEDPPPAPEAPTSHPPYTDAAFGVFKKDGLWCLVQIPYHVDGHVGPYQIVETHAEFSVITHQFKLYASKTFLRPRVF